MPSKVPLKRIWFWLAKTKKNGVKYAYGLHNGIYRDDLCLFDRACGFNSSAFGDLSYYAYRITIYYWG